MVNLLKRLPFLALPLLLAGCMAAAGNSPSMTFSSHAIAEPTKSRLVVCHGFGCHYKTPVTLTATDIRTLKRIMARGRNSPEAERRALSKAVIWFDKRTGPVVGTTVDVGGLDIGNARKRGQQDCIDESNTMTGLLVLMEKQGMFKHHRAGQAVTRGFFLDMRYPHATGTIIETKTGKAFAVDQWPYGYAGAPDIIPLEEWYRIRSGGARDVS